ncbi:fused DSP-PTPase phosphatase/NAD kinase-like protein [Antarcticimicrobium luteum]|uniref:Protein tyrosine phosphatase n=1 Tax=Antarcticimicrobium luteum TaxID=2547397 RepID=A0A4R5VD40_9RHOB|nr:tyrosine-protein phosphatase [Antarcticimicrobium luteum]TDK49665.1 protein tyrosine phosphatase [Antarcticimicrobium luteum]
MGLAGRIRQFERDVRAYFNVDPRIPGNERRARIYNRYFDHAILRGIWTNEYEIAPGVYRSNHPTHERFAQMAGRGIHTVLNLRGASVSAHYLTEKASCEALGLTLVNATLHARAAASRDEILHLIEVFRRIGKPFVMHCKSGADRAGFASSVYLLAIEGRPVSEARRMLSWRFFHVRNSKVGILDYILDTYEARHRQDAISFEDWIATEYDPQEIETRFRQGKTPA